MEDSIENGVDETPKRNPYRDFAIQLFKNESKYKNIAKLIADCKTKLPVSAYIGYKIGSEKDINLISEQHGIEIMFPKCNPDEIYNYIIVKHKIIASKDRFIHFDPFQEIYLKGAGAKSEFFDPKIPADIEKDALKKVLFNAKKISYRTLPIDIKLQTGLKFLNIDEEIEWMEERIAELQEELGENLQEVGFNEEPVYC